MHRLSPVVVGGLLIAVASLVVEHWLLGCTVFSTVSLIVAVPGLQGTGYLIVVVRGLSCSTACGIFLDQGLNPCLLHWQEDSLPLNYEGSQSMRPFLFPLKSEA